jgi:hypothetical protein
MTTRTIIATSVFTLAAAVLAVGMPTAAGAGTVVNRAPAPTGAVSKIDTPPRKYHPPRGCLGDPTCKLPGPSGAGNSGIDSGINCTYTTHGTCSPD